MVKRIGLLFAGLALFATGALAGDTPWIDDESLIRQVQSEVETGGVMAVSKHVDALEKALREAS